MALAIRFAYRHVVHLSFVCSMLQFLQILSSIFVIVLLIPQTNTVNFLLRRVYDSGVFAFYSEAKRFLQRLTWGSVVFFFVISYICARS